MDILFFKVYRNTFLKGKIYSYIRDLVNNDIFLFTLSLNEFRSVITTYNYTHCLDIYNFFCICLYKFLSKYNLIFRKHNGENLIYLKDKRLSLYIRDVVDLLICINKIIEYEEYDSMNKYLYNHNHLFNEINFNNIKNSFIKQYIFNSAMYEYNYINIFHIVLDDKFNNVSHRTLVNNICREIRKVFYNIIFYTIKQIIHIRSHSELERDIGYFNDFLSSIFLIDFSEEFDVTTIICSKIDKLTLYIDGGNIDQDIICKLFFSILKTTFFDYNIIKLLESVTKYKLYNFSNENIYLNTKDSYIHLLTMNNIDYKKILERISYYCRKDIININMSKNYAKYIDIYNTEDNINTDNYNNILTKIIYYHVIDIYNNRQL